MEGLNDKDYFSRLPNELVEAVLLDAWIKGPPSKRFLPIFHRVFYRRIRLSEYANLALLCRTAQSHSSLMANVKVFDFTLDDRGHWEDPLDPSSESLTLLLQNFEYLHTLTINGSSRFAMLVFGNPVTYPFFATLERVLLDFPPTDFPELFDPSQLLVTISHYPALRDVRYVMAHRYRSIQNTFYSLRMLPQLPHFDLIETFRLGGPLNNSPLVPLISSYFPALTTLILEDLSDNRETSQITDFLKYLPNPQKLEALHLWIRHGATSPALSLARILPIFTNLKQLTLPEIPFDTIYPVLTTLPLLHLTFALNERFPPTTSELSKLLSGSMKINSLVTLELDNLFAEEGESIPLNIDPQDVAEMDPSDLGWELTRWSDGFRQSGLDELWRLGLKEGVEVLGEAIAALSIEEDWEDEVERHRKAWACREK